MTATTTDRSAANLAAVREIYKAFGRGDVPAILARIAPGCRWESWASNRAQRDGVPTLQPRTGADGVAEFFGVVGGLVIHDFQILDILASGSQAAAEVVIEVSTPAGGRFRDEELHLWTLNDDHQVTRMRHYVDTAKHIAAFAGEDTTA